MAPSSDSEVDSLSSVERNIKESQERKKSYSVNCDDEDFENEDHNEIQKLRKNKYVCNIESCGMSFSRIDRLDRHVFVHTGVKKHFCCYTDCDKTYITSAHLERHIRTFHEKIRKEKNVKCRLDHCNIMFDSIHNMEKHMTIHEKTRIFKCSQCEKQFKRKHLLRIHEITHTGDFPFNCEKCKKGFVQAFHLQIHKCKIYTCEVCSNIFSKWSQLVEHKQMHHKKLHPCTNCGKVFNKKSILKAHEEYHKEKLDREVIQCPIEGCPRYYFHQKNLNHHIKVKHEGKKFKCPIENCKMELVTKQKLDLHIKKIHENKKSPVKKAPEIKKQRKNRKDRGQSKNSLALKLAGITANPKLEKQIINNEIDIQISDKTEDDNNGAANENEIAVLELTEFV